MPIEAHPKPPSGPKPSKTGGKKSVTVSTANSAINTGSRLKKARPKTVEDDDEGIMPYTQAMGRGKHALLLNTDNIQGMLPSPERSPSKNSLFGGFSIDNLIAMSSPVCTVSITKETAVVEEPSVVDELAQPSVNSVNEPSSVASAGSVESLSPLKLSVTSQLKVIEKALPGIKIDRNMRRSIMVAMQDMNYWDEAEEKEFDKLDINEAQRKAMLLAAKSPSTKGKSLRPSIQPAGSIQRVGKVTKVSLYQSQPTAANQANVSPQQASLPSRSLLIPSPIKVKEEKTQAAAILDPQDQAIINIAGKLKKNSLRMAKPPPITTVASHDNISDNNSHSTNSKAAGGGGIRGRLKKSIHAIKDIIVTNKHNSEDKTAVIPPASPRSPKQKQQLQQLSIDTTMTTPTHHAQPQTKETSSTTRKQRSPGKRSMTVTTPKAANNNNNEVGVTEEAEAEEVRSPPSRAGSIAQSSPTRSSIRMMNSKQSLTRSSMNTSNNNNNGNSEIMQAMAAAVAAVNAAGLTSLTSSMSVSGNSNNNTSARDALEKEIKDQFVNKAVTILVNLHNNPPPSPLSTVSLSSSTSTTTGALNSSNRKDMKAMLIRKYSTGIVERGLKRAKLSFERAVVDYRIQSTKLHRLQEKRIIIIQRAWHHYLGRKCCHRILSIGRTFIDDKITQEIRDLDEFRMRIARRRLREEKAFQQWKGVQVHKPTFPLTPILEERVKKTLIRVNSSGVALTPADSDLFKQDERHLRPDLAPFSDHINATIHESITNVHEIMHQKRQQALVQQQEDIRRQQRMKEIEESVAMPFSTSNAGSPLTSSAAYRRDSAARMEMLMLGAMGKSISMMQSNNNPSDPNSNAYFSASPSSPRKGSLAHPSPRGDQVKQLTPRQESIATHLTPTSLPQRQPSRLSVAAAAAASRKDSLTLSLSMINTTEILALRPPTADNNWEEMARVDNTPSIQAIREEKKYKSPAFKMLEQLCGLTEEDIAKHRLERRQSVAGVVTPRNPLTTSSFIFM